jgi:hypothetical protein
MVESGVDVAVKRRDPGGGQELRQRKRGDELGSWWVLPTDCVQHSSRQTTGACAQVVSYRAHQNANTFAAKAAAKGDS